MAIRNVSEEMKDYWEKFISISKSSVDFRFRTWFVGFIEGFDNKAFIRKGFESVHFELKLPILEKELINYIVENFKPLNIQTTIILTKKSVFLKIVEPQSLLKIISLFSGSIFLREYFNRFRFWIAVFRYLFDIHIVFFKKTIQNLPDYSYIWLTQTSWLSGLLDARCYFTKISFKSSYNQFEFSSLEGQLILPMKVSREIKLFEGLSKNYGGKLKILELNKVRKFYYCIDIISARKFCFYISKNVFKTKKSNFFNLFFNLLKGCEGLIRNKLTLGFYYFEKQKKEWMINKLINDYNFQLSQTNFCFNHGDLLKDVWKSMFELRASKRAQSRGGQYANFLENKYKHVFTLKPKSMQINISKSLVILFVISFLQSFKVYAFFRKCHYKIVNQNINRYNHSIYVVNLLKRYQFYSFTNYLCYFIDPKKLLSNCKNSLLENIFAMKARNEFSHMFRNYDMVIDDSEVYDDDEFYEEN